mgnify:CR=1 FL=1
MFDYVLEDGEIARIAVESDFRRNGVASRLMKELAFICADNGVNKLLLDVRESNESAKAFYKKKGFCPGWRAEKVIIQIRQKCDS